MWFQIRAYLRFLWHSKNEHAVHSPFVFQLVTRCFYDGKKYPDYTKLSQQRSSLLQDNTAIDVTDFGAGSRVFRSNRRQISAIAKTAGISRTRVRLLYRLTSYLKPDNMLELGTSLGLGTSALSLGNPSAIIHTIEGCPQTAAVAALQWKALGLDNIHLAVGTFESVLQQADFGQKKYDLVYFDGHHSQEATLRLVELLLPTIGNNTVWVFDDIHWSAGMEQAWEFLKKQPQVTVTIDTFQWGLVFFRKEQQKENFMIRI